MFTSSGLQQGYQPDNPAMSIGVRGDSLGGAGPLDWDSSRTWLQRESTDPDTPAYHLFSGVVYYPESLAGKTQKYKFIVDPSGWEGGNLQGDRQLVITSNDQSIHWVYFGDTDPIVVAVHTIPGTIEAEDFASMSGIQTEPTGDAGGGVNVGWLDDNDWLDYHIDVRTSGRYIVELRIARLSSSGDSSGQFRIGGETLCAFSVPPTGGWQNWRTIQTSLQLSAGRHTLRLYVAKGDGTSIG